MLSETRISHYFFSPVSPIYLLDFFPAFFGSISPLCLESRRIPDSGSKWAVKLGLPH